MYERLKELCKKRGINITKLCEEVTNSSGNLSAWKKGYMRSDYLALVADRLHELRHLNAAIMLYLGIPSKYAMERGGWDDINTMDKIYQFTFEDEKKTVDDKINNFFDSLLDG